MDQSPKRIINDNTVDGNPEDLSIFVQDMLDQMHDSFNVTGNTIIGRMDEVGKRMDDLERSINDLMEQAGLDGPEQAATSAAQDTSYESKESARV